MSSESDSGGLFIAGALSGFMEAIVVQPFDMIKTRHQLNPGKNASVSETLRMIYQEGGISRFYRGMTAEIIGIMPKSSGMYASYELARRVLAQDEVLPLSDLIPRETTRSIVVAFLAGGFSGIPEAMIVTPTQVVKVRLQSKQYLGRYHNTWDCFQKIVREEGIMAMTIGLGPTFYRNCVWNSVYFSTMQALKTALPTPKEMFPSSTSRQLFFLDQGITLVTGFFGAVFATCFNAPFDVVKSRIQSQVTSNGQEVLKYRNTLQSLALIYKEEGLAACYKGFQPKAIRMGLGGGVAMVTFEIFGALFASDKKH